MSPKRIVLIIMCSLLAVMVIMMGVMIGKFSPILGMLLGFGDDPSQTTPPTTQTDPPPTTTVPPTTVPPTTVPPTTPPPTTELPHTHEFSTVKEDHKATCEADGFKIYVCECGETKLETIDALPHSFGAGKLIVPTCTQEGYTLRKCSVCGFEDKQDVKEALGHSYKETETVTPTCEVDGYVEFQCETCKDIKRENVIKATGHNWQKGAVFAPTCTDKGYTEYSCSNENCDLKTKIDDEVEALGHDFSQWAVDTEPTAGNPGTEKRVCSACNEEETRACELAIMSDKGINSSEDGGVNHYIINVGAKDSSGKEVTVFSYDITDRSGYISKDSFRYDPESGLIITFRDGEGKTQSYVLTSDKSKFIIGQDGKQDSNSATGPSTGGPEGGETEPTTGGAGNGETDPTTGTGTGEEE